MVPIAIRSCRSMTTAASQPLFSSPMMPSAGTRTLSKKTSLKGECPVATLSGRTVTPGACMSTMNMLMPLCLGFVGSVLARIAPKSLNWAPDVQTFCPLMTHSSPSRTALVCRLATSEPAPGSEKSWHQISSPRSILGR